MPNRKLRQFPPGFDSFLRGERPEYLEATRRRRNGSVQGEGEL